MSPKEKANELVDKYRVELMLTDTKVGEEILCTSVAKKCALICVDEMLDMLFLNSIENENLIAYYLDVKTEIYKL
jgi:hypothetical protein